MAHRLMVPALLLAGTPSPAAAQIYHVKEMNTAQIRALDRSKIVVLMPGGILEQHGPYLPSFTDGYRNERMTQELADAIVARSGWKVVIFPTIPLGAGGANEIGSKHSFPGTYAVRASTLRAVFMDLATELGEQGFRWIFVIHVHGAPRHNEVIDHASDYFHDTYHGHMVNLTGLLPLRPPRREFVERLEGDAQKEEGSSPHADALETSEILFLRPDLVDPGYSKAMPHTAADPNDWVRVARAPDWPGYIGSPRVATAALGAWAWKLYSSRIVDLALNILDGADYRRIPRYADSGRLQSQGSANAVSLQLSREAEARERLIEKKQSEWLRAKKLGTTPEKENK